MPNYASDIAFTPTIKAIQSRKGYQARTEHALLFSVKAWDANCPQHIPQRLEAADVANALAARDQRIAELEAKLARFGAQ